MVHLILIITNYFLLITLFNTIYLLYSLWGGNSLFYNFLFPGGNSYHFELPPWGMDFANIFIYTLWDGLNLWTSPLRTGLYLFISSPLRTGISLLIIPPPWGGRIKVGVNISRVDGNFEKTFYCILHLYFNFNLKTRNVLFDINTALIYNYYED